MNGGAVMNLFETAADRLIIVAHRGSCAGNVPCNTMAAYKAALTQGADMIEVDAAGNPDGGWGWLADRGYDLIRTDWPLMMRLYPEETGRRFRR